MLPSPYRLILKLRHRLYDSGIRKVSRSPIPAVSVGNVAVGGTGKTPHTEMILRLLLSHSRWKGKNIAVLSRGYKRKTKGFQQVVTDGRAADFGDEPMQIKRKFPNVTVAVDKDRVEGCSFLADPGLLSTSKKARKCRNRDISRQNLVILDDAMQYRTLKPDVSIVLVNYSKSPYEDKLLPAGRLRDLPERIETADIVIVTKSPFYMDEWERSRKIASLRMRSYNPETCTAVNRQGEKQHIFFSGIRYCQPEAVFTDGDSRYTYSKKAILVSGIADDTPLVRYLSDSYKVVRRISFPDHHNFTDTDIRTICKAAAEHPTALIATTEKDSQRFLDCGNIPESIRQKMFYIPIKVDFIHDGEEERFISVLDSLLPE